MTDVRIDHGTSSGTFTIDGQTHEVENNIWVVGNDKECLVIDAPHNVDDIMAVVGDREVIAIVLTHAHDDHCRVAPELSTRTLAPVLLNRNDYVLWSDTHPGVSVDGELFPEDRLLIGSTTVRVLHTPGHSPGGSCLYLPELGVLFSGDTLFQGGPGATGQSYSDEDQLLDSIHRQLLGLPDETVVHTGHGESTTIGAERAALEAE